MLTLAVNTVEPAAVRTFHRLLDSDHKIHHLQEMVPLIQPINLQAQRNLAARVALLLQCF